MFIKAVATSLGGVTFVGGGVAIYLYNNKSNSEKPDNSDKENPELNTEDNKLDKKSEENVTQTKTQSNKQAKKSTVKKAVNTSTHTYTEVPDDEFYFLAKMNENLKTEHVEGVKKIEFKINDPSSFLTNEEKYGQAMDLPFYCFEGENVDSKEELNLENLKKCKDIKSTIENKFVVIYYGDISGTETSGGGKSFAVLNSSKPTFQYILTKTGGQTVENSGEIISIFEKNFSPGTITKNA